ncbi:MAG TPA: M20/M25/M40 family metallo-hydrolase [Gemmatimonadales bacterium]|nr:M20/M25/M40 family metallo-hydrolase [Gemmatimonadales bacterium]
MSDPFELVRRLVAVESPTGAEAPATDLLAAHLGALGYHVELQAVAPGRRNLFAWREPPALVFSTHLDTVPPYVPLREDGEFIYGRGSCDAKGLAAAMVAASERLAAQGERRIGLLFVVGEENGSDGAQAAAQLSPKGRFLINGEPTENLLTVGQKGALRVDLAATGRAAHSAYPAEGDSALLPLLDAIERIRGLHLPSDPMLGPSTLNVGSIHAGVAPNVIPPEASAQLLIRTVGPTEELRKSIRSAAGSRVSVRFAVEIPAYKGAAPPGWDSTVVSFASDLPFLQPWGRCFQMGPGSIRVAHTAEERIGKQEYLDGIDRYVALATDLLASEGS